MRWILVFVTAACGRVAFDAVPSDAGAGDGSGAADTTPPSCGIPGALFCDGFESVALDAWTVTGGQAARQTALVRTGVAALGAPVDPAVQSFVAARSIGGVTTGSLHARAWFYFPSGVPLSKLEILGVEGDTGSSQILILIDQEEIRGYSELALVTYPTGVTVTRDRWQCMELNITLSDTAGAMSMQIDGVPIAATSGFDTLPDVGYKAIIIGAKFSFPGQAVTSLNVDDVVVGTQPIGCN